MLQPVAQLNSAMWNNTGKNKTLEPACVSSFLLSLKEGIAAGYDNFQICWFGDQVYPNACVPIAGIIQHFKKTEN